MGAMKADDFQALVMGLLANFGGQSRAEAKLLAQLLKGCFFLGINNPVLQRRKEAAGQLLAP